MDTSVSMTVGAEMNVVSHLEPNEFAHRVLELMPSDVKSADLGCGRILTDWSILLQTRYVMCDIYEDGVEEVAHPESVASTDSDSADGHSIPEESKRWKYHIEIKYGQKNSRAADIIYGAMFLLAFWFASRFNVFTLILSVLLILAAVFLIISTSRYKFGPVQCEKIRKALQSAEK